MPIVPQRRPDLESVLQAEILQVGLLEQVTQRSEEVDELLDARQVENVRERLLGHDTGLPVGISAFFRRIQQGPV